MWLNSFSKNTFLILVSSILAGNGISAQQKDSTTAPEVKSNPVTVGGYVDAYYAYYTDSVGQGNFQKFPTTAPRSNSFGLNMAMITAKYTADKIRATVTLHFGDIVLSTWNKTYTIIQEANAGFRISKKLWLDAGIFRTHVGTEGLFGKENITSSVAVGTFNEPYYEAGLRLNCNPTDKLALSFFMLNGYNIIEDNNDKKSFGILAAYTFNDNLNIGYTNYIGDDSPRGDSITHTRFYNNLFLNYQKKKFKMQVGGDYGMQQHSDSTQKNTATMFSVLATFRYQLPSRFGIYGRGEVFNDPTGFLGGVIIDKMHRKTGYKLYGATVGIEYKPTDNSYIRLEARQLQCDANQEIFRWNGHNQANRSEIMVHIGVHF